MTKAAEKKLVAYWKKKADGVFSQYVRKRDGNMCVVCGKRDHVSNGHLISRKTVATFFDEDNCHAQCRGCNKRHNYHPEHYTEWFIRRYGFEAYQALIARSLVKKVFISTELEMTHRYYATKVNQMYNL